MREDLMRYWLWMQAMEYALNALKGKAKAKLYPMSEYDMWKYTGWQELQHNMFRHVLDNWETPSYQGGMSGHSHYDTGYDITLNGAGVISEYKDMTVTIKWPEIKKFIQELLTPSINIKQLDLFEILAQEAIIWRYASDNAQ
jgi:hypothetical protein